jgi:hypothetical protein
MLHPTVLFHSFLLLVSSLNMFTLRRVLLWTRPPALPARCALVFTLVCAFRSLLPRVDAERICMFNHPLSWPFLGRSLATIAEISFGVLESRWWGARVAALGHPRLARAGSALAAGCMAVAQGWCWMGVVTKNNMYHAVEEALWLISHTFLMLASVYVLVGGGGQRAGKDLALVRRQLLLHAVFLVPYNVYMLLLDVPMYLHKYQTHPKVYLGVFEGVLDSMSCQIVTRGFDVWGGEVLWLSGYFSLAVWAAQYFAATWRPWPANK